MTLTTLKRALATLAVVAAALIIYNGHAGLGIQDGTSNTMMWSRRRTAPASS